MLMARVVDGVVVELQDAHPDGHDFADCFPPETAALFVEVPDNTHIGDTVAAPDPSR